MCHALGHLSRFDFDWREVGWDHRDTYVSSFGPEFAPSGVGARRRLPHTDHPAPTNHDIIAADRNGQIPLLGYLDGHRRQSPLQVVRRWKPSPWSAPTRETRNDHRQASDLWNLFLDSRRDRQQNGRAATHTPGCNPGVVDHRPVAPATEVPSVGNDREQGPRQATPPHWGPKGQNLSPKATGAIPSACP